MAQGAYTIARLLWCIAQLRQGRPSACVPLLIDLVEELRRQELGESELEHRGSRAFEAPSSCSIEVCEEEEEDDRYIWDQHPSRWDW